MPHLILTLVLSAAALLAAPARESADAPPPAALAPPVGRVERRPSAAFSTPVFEYRCHGQDAWVRWRPGARDCTGRYPMFPEGEVARSWCPRGAGAFPDLPWRRAQAGTADWRIVDEAGALLSGLTGACVDDPGMFDRIDDRLFRCGSNTYARARDVHAAGCTNTAFHTGPAVFAAFRNGTLPNESIIRLLLRTPPYDAYPSH